MSSRLFFIAKNYNQWEAPWATYQTSVVPQFGDVDAIVTDAKALRRAA
jgi:hypothetical protein